AEAEACVALGRSEEAARLAIQQLEGARRVGTPRILGTALRVRAGCLGAEAAGDLLVEATELLERTPARVELGRALLGHGAILRRTGQRQAARGPLLRALELADRTGCRSTVGARPRRARRGRRPASPHGADRSGRADHRGTPSRRARSPGPHQPPDRLAPVHHLPTVETHLRHVFQKLDITSSTELVSRLAPEAPTSDPRPVT